GRRQAPLRMAMLALRLAAHRLATVSAERADLVIMAPTAGGTSDARGRVLFDLGRATAVEAAPRIAALQAERLRPPPDRSGRQAGSSAPLAASFSPRVRPVTGLSTSSLEGPARNAVSAISPPSGDQVGRSTPPAVSGAMKSWRALRPSEPTDQSATS